MSGFFVTGTDTDCGKTLVCLGLMAWYQQRGERVGALKPVAAGAVATAGSLRNDDALKLLAQMDDDTPYEQVNPYCFEPPIAPHLAAMEAGVALELAPVVDAWQALRRNHDRVLVEGAGGWRVPLGDGFGFPEVARELQLPVLLVVGLKLGCINHALLTAEAIISDGLTLAGWVANCVDGALSRRQDNLQTLRQRIPAPLLGVVPRLDTISPETVAAALDSQALQHLDDL